MIWKQAAKILKEIFIKAFTMQTDKIPTQTKVIRMKKTLVRIHVHELYGKYSLSRL